MELTSIDQKICFIEQKDVSESFDQGFSMKTITLEEKIRYAQVRLDEKLFDRFPLCTGSMSYKTKEKLNFPL
jgi:hypothetical protein